MKKLRTRNLGEEPGYRLALMGPGLWAIRAKGKRPGRGWEKRGAAPSLLRIRPLGGVGGQTDFAVISDAQSPLGKGGGAAQGTNLPMVTRKGVEHKS